MILIEKTNPYTGGLKLLVYDDNNTKRRRFKRSSEAEREVIEKLSELGYGIRESKGIGKSASSLLLQRRMICFYNF